MEAKKAFLAKHEDDFTVTVKNRVYVFPEEMATGDGNMLVFTPTQQACEDLAKATKLCLPGKNVHYHHAAGSSAGDLAQVLNAIIFCTTVIQSGVTVNDCRRVLIFDATIMQEFGDGSIPLKERTNLKNFLFKQTTQMVRRPFYDAEIEQMSGRTGRTSQGKVWIYKKNEAAHKYVGNDIIIRTACLLANKLRNDNDFTDIGNVVTSGMFKAEEMLRMVMFDGWMFESGSNLSGLDKEIQKLYVDPYYHEEMGWQIIIYITKFIKINIL